MAPRDQQAPQRFSSKHVAGRMPQRRRAAMADSATQEDQCHPRKIFVGGLADKTTTQGLREHFQRFGAIVDAVVLRWPDGRSRGFGYITFADIASASAALREAHQVGGREVDVKRAVPGTNKLFVGGLPQNTSAAELRKHFETFGVVSDAVVMIDPSTNRSRGFGFVCFLPGQEGSAAVTSALEQYQNHRIRGKWIEVKSAAPPHKLASKSSPDASPHSELSEDSLSTPVSEPQDLSAPPGLSHVGRLSVEHEPQKVSFPGMAAPLGASFSQPPPGLGMPPDAAVNMAGGWQPEFGMQSSHAAPGAPAMIPWQTPGTTWSAPSGAKNPTSANAFGDSAAHSAAAGNPGYFDASKDLQRSLEQLLRLQAGEVKPKANTYTPSAAEDLTLLPSIMADGAISVTKLEI